jgi:hypothetical protein
MIVFRWPAVALLAALLAAPACKGNSSSPSSPTGSANLSLGGTWNGTASDSSGPGQMTWNVTHSGGSISGTFSMVDTQTKLTGRGSLAGTLSGSTLKFSLRVPAGGFDAPHGACQSEVSGEAEASAIEIAGTYSGTSTCAGTIAFGQFRLSR